MSRIGPIGWTMECCLLTLLTRLKVNVKGKYSTIPYQCQLGSTLTKVVEHSYLIIPPPLDGRSITSRLFIPTDHTEATFFTRQSSTASEPEMSSPTDQTPGMSSGGGGERRRVSAPHSARLPLPLSPPVRAAGDRLIHTDCPVLRFGDQVRRPHESKAQFQRCHCRCPQGQFRRTEQQARCVWVHVAQVS